ncbi:MAG: 2-oxoacid:acceptor oxidoreductase family protein [Bryobacterales bacterium]|nr:2-oxoacid:acceptor oxidoreductase family protein [Bryobacterales bacterium]
MFFVNNGIYGMTGGQMAPTTLLGQKTTTSPLGRNALNEGFPIRVCEVLAALEAPVYLERVALGNPKQVQTARRAIRKALQNQVERKGFSLVEILSPCPTIWKMPPQEAQRHVREAMIAAFPPGVYRDRTAETEARPAAPPAPALDEIPRLLDIDAAIAPLRVATPSDVDLRIKVAGFGGQGVLMLGEVLAEAGLLLDLEVSWLPSYGPEMRSGTSHCHVRIGSKPIDSPLVAKPNVLLALNEPSLRKFLPTVEPGGTVVYNGTALPEDLHAPEGVHVLAMPCSELADGLGASKVGNIVMLGALLEATRCLPEEAVDQALATIVKSERWLALDREAIHLGWDEARKGACHAYC